MSSIELIDYQWILKIKGDIVGTVKYVAIDSIVDDVFKLLESELKMAKGLILEFDIKKDSSAFCLTEHLESLHNLINEESVLTYTVNEVENMEDGYVTCRLILVGL